MVTTFPIYVALSVFLPVVVGVGVTRVALRANWRPYLRVLVLLAAFLAAPFGYALLLQGFYLGLGSPLTLPPVVNGTLYGALALSVAVLGFILWSIASTWSVRA